MSRLVVFFFLFALAIPIDGLNPRKLDEIIENKCVACRSPPPPQPKCPPPLSPQPPPPPLPESPPPPSPPPPIPPSPPSQPPPVGPPPPLRPPPPSKICPPPPYGAVPPSEPIAPGNGHSVYVTGPPGGLYPVDHPFSGAENRFTMGLPLLIGGILFLGLFLSN